jgi:hypothetical protein
MSRQQSETNVNTRFINAPQSLSDQRMGYAYFNDDYSNPVPNEGNLLTLMTIKDFYKGDTDVEKALSEVGKEENRYLVKAAQILSQPDNSKIKSAKKLQQKFGRDLKGATALAQLLKEKTIEYEFRMAVEPIAEDLAKENISKRGGLVSS